jgi:hypothetical protein
MTEHAQDHVEFHLTEFSENGHVLFRENRSLWQLTPDGRAAHQEHLAEDLQGLDPVAALADQYTHFIELNSAFKELCGAWQLRDGEPNDHSDPKYDGMVLGQLTDLHGEALPVIGEIGERIHRMSPYSRRLDRVLERLRGGETSMFTGVMCGSYHDAWMELHEDLILTQGIDRAEEGSF